VLWMRMGEQQGRSTMDADGGAACILPHRRSSTSCCRGWWRQSSKGRPRRSSRGRAVGAHGWRRSRDDGGRADASAPEPTLGDQNQSRREVTLYLLLREHQPANSFSRHRFQRSCSPKQLPASAQADQIEDFCAAWASHSAPTHPPAPLSLA
jgi:hypothetical protein